MSDTIYLKKLMTNSRNNLLKENKNLYFPSLLEKAWTLWAWGQAYDGKVYKGV